jgi:hypothetical protein
MCGWPSAGMVLQLVRAGPEHLAIATWAQPNKGMAVRCRRRSRRTLTGQVM